MSIFGGSVRYGINGRPIAPKWKSLVDRNTGDLKSGYKLEDTYGPLQGLNAYKQEASRDPSQQSQWASHMQNQLENKRLANISDLGTQTRGQNMQAWSDLAASGGASSGARERIAKEGARNQMLTAQNVNGKTAFDLLPQESHNEVAQLFKNLPKKLQLHYLQQLQKNGTFTIDI
jgi:hypothetical protein